MKTKNAINVNDVPRYRIGYAMRLTGLSRDGVIAAVNRGDLKAYKMGQYRFTQNDLERYMESCRTGVPDDDGAYKPSNFALIPGVKPLIP